ncbi:MAG TPA: DUF72 domain-containing protein [Xanthomonadaceae bacterium]|jgi:uncharacterized protein YecE (DUF72 family)|nr:DUF72 domain-containing protein [Xanthomonadaceae bacterium]
MPARIRIGVAGWSILSRHRALFGEEGSHLARYATRLDVVEINSSFYRPHAAATYARWAAQVPPGFRFSVKLPRAVTHDARLVGCGALLDRFAGEVAGLGRRLGGVLVQLPPSLAFDGRVAHRFFAMLRRRFDCAIACEPRHASWFAPGVDALWQRHAVARVAADPARVPEAGLPGGAGRWAYFRWHGSPRMYYDSYDDARLRDLAQALRAAARGRRTAWCIFDNTAGGHALADAARLQAMLATP